MTSNTVKILHHPGSLSDFSFRLCKFLGAKQRKKEEKKKKNKTKKLTKTKTSIISYASVKEQNTSTNTLWHLSLYQRKGFPLTDYIVHTKALVLYTIRWYIKWLVNASLMTSSLSLHFPMGTFWRNRHIIIGTQEYRAY